MSGSARHHFGFGDSRIGLGTWGLGGIYYGDVPDRQGIETVRAYIDGGGRHLDSAFSYHKSEEVVGAAIQRYNREDLFITSKTYAGCFPEKKDLRDVQTHCEISLRDLRTDYLDQYMIHGTPADADLLNRILDEFEKLKAAGKIRSIGCSIPGPCVTERSRDTALMAIQTGRVDCLQLTYSIARQKHGDVFQVAQEQGVAVIARWVLESGMLSGKYEVGHSFAWPDTRNRYRPAERDAILQIGHQLAERLPEGYENPAQLAVGFALAQPGVTGIILGSNTPDQARRNLQMNSLPVLPDRVVQELRTIYGAMNDRCNPTGDFEHVDSPRRPLEGTSK